MTGMKMEPVSGVATSSCLLTWDPGLAQAAALHCPRVWVLRLEVGGLLPTQAMPLTPSQPVLHLMGSLCHTCHHPHSLSLQPSQTLSPPPWGHFSNKYLPPPSYSLCPSSLWFPLLGSLFHAAQLESHSPDCGWPFFPSAVPLPGPTPWLSPAFPQTFFLSPLSNWPRPVPLNVLQVPGLP